MKKFVIALCIMLAIIIFVTSHTVMIMGLSNDVSEISDRIDENYRAENWDEILEGLDELQERWDKSRLWACMTIKTKEIEEIEISLRQSKEYALSQAKDDFIGEFIMFRMLVEHLPHQEGFSIDEVL